MNVRYANRWKNIREIEKKEKSSLLKLAYESLIAVASLTGRTARELHLSRSQRAGHSDCCFAASANNILLIVGLAAVVERVRVLSEVVNISVGLPPPLLNRLVVVAVRIVRAVSNRGDVPELTEVLRVGFLGLGGLLGDPVRPRKFRNLASAVLYFL